MSKQRYVYFIRPVGMPGLVKIGFSNNPAKRLDNMLCWSPIPLEIAATIPGDIKLEGRIHGLFKDCHSHREWFNETPQLTRFIERLAAGESIEALTDMSAPAISLRAGRPRKNPEKHGLPRTVAA
jgi:hypothetical protein